MSLKFYLYWCPKFSSINLCLFGNRSNALQQWVNSHIQFITIWRTWIKFTLLVDVCLMVTWIKHCSLMMNLTRPFEVQNGANFFLSHLEDKTYPKKVQWLDLASQLWPMLKGLLFVKMVYAHFIVIMQFSKSLFSFWYPSYSWFKQFEGSLSGDLVISQLPFGDVLSKP